MFSFNNKNKQDVSGALTLSAAGAAVAAIRRDKSGRPLLEQCGFYPSLPEQDPSANLKQAVAEHGLGKTGCSTLLAIGKYQLLMVEAPEVPPSELRAAIRWRIRDLIDFHIDDAVLDVFDVPPSGARALQEHLYVVVSRTETVREQVEVLERAGVTLQTIDIPELALRNIAAQLEQDANGQAMLYFDADQGLITLTRDATLYLARSMDTGYRQLQETPGLVDRLALELQRSMDYYDRHFQQAPITSITLCPMPAPMEPLAEQLEQQVGVPVHRLQADDIVEIHDSIGTETFAHCLLAIGAALRSEPAQL
ncbi:MAG: type IV pilus biogenesis protein PilM [Thiogranum sp.]